MKFVKKLTALFLAIVMTMAMGITVFADAPADHVYAKQTITISGAVEGHTYKVYQILKGDKNDDFSETAGTGTLTNLNKGSNLATTTKTADQIAEELSKLSGADLGDKAYALIDTTTKPAATLSSTNTSAEVEMGYYIIVDAEYTGTATENVVYSRYVTAVVGNTTVKPKTSTPEVDKKIVDTDANKPLDTDGKTDTAAIGDTINYEITGTVPNTTGYKYYYYVINDTLSKGLTYSTDPGLKVTIAQAEKDAAGEITGYKKAVDLTEKTDYYLYVGAYDAEEGTDIKVAFADMKGLYEKYGEDAKITVTYDAIINENAVIGLNPNKNTVNLTYSNKPGDSEKYDKENEPGIPDKSKVPTGETPKEETLTFVTEIELTKVDKDTQLPLAGAEFTLTGTNLNKIIVTTYTEFTQAANGEYYKLKTGEYTTTAPITEDYTEGEGDNQVTVKANKDLYETDESGEFVKYTKGTGTKVTKGTGETETTVKATVGSDGKIVFTGLNAGEYRLVESVVPDGYSKVEDITFTIGADLKGSNAELNKFEWKADTTNISCNDGKFSITIENKKGSVLPSTGGMGTTVIYIAGIAMIVAAGVVVIARKRMA